MICIYQMTYTNNILLTLGNGTTLRDPLVKSLKLIGHSLTDLTVLRCPGIQLRDILETCPNLVSLKTSSVDAVMPLSPSSRYPKLKHLVLDNTSGSAPTQDSMVDVISRFPSLLSLEVSPMPESKVLTLLHKHCPYLQIIFGDVFRACNDLDTRNLLPDRKAITSAYLRGTDGFCFQDDLIELLLQNRNTIQALEFGAELEDGHDPIWNISSGRLMRRQQQSSQLDISPSEILFPHLIQLDFRNLSPQQSVPLLKWILLNAPNLKVIQLDDIQFTPDITDAMIKMKHLSKLQLDIKNYIFEGFDMTDYYPRVKQFFEHHIAMGDQSTLQDLGILFDDLRISQFEWLSMLSRLRRLKNLELSTTMAMTGNCKQVMAEICQGCPALETLTLDAWRGFADGVMESLYQLSHVQYLKIRGSSLSKVNLLSIAKMPSLERLLFHRCRVPDEVRSLLQQVRPNIKILLVYQYVYVASFMVVLSA